MTPIPPAPFLSVCVDIFSLTEVSWQNQSYDSLVLCVNRHSGWMIAQPTLKNGLTAEKCVHLLLDGGWTQIGVPTTITSDQVPQFVGQWFQTMCWRLGIREAFSQAYGFLLFHRPLYSYHCPMKKHRAVAWSDLRPWQATAPPSYKPPRAL